METTFNIGSVSNLTRNVNTSTTVNNQTITPEQIGLSLQTVDNISIVTHAIGVVSTIAFTLQNENIGNLKSIGLDLKSKENITYKDRLDAGGSAIKNLAGGMASRATHGLIVEGVISAAINGYKVLTNKESSTEAVSTFAADIVRGTLSGAGCALAGGLTALGLGFAGVTGLPGIVLIGGASLLGSIGTHMLTEESGLYDSIKNHVTGFITTQKQA